MDAPEVRYVKTPDGAHLANQVLGAGAFDLVFVPGPGAWQVYAASGPQPGGV